jgi:hypothetical protein
MDWIQIITTAGPILAGLAWVYLRIDKKFDATDKKFEHLEHKFDHKLEKLEQKISAEIKDVRSDIKEVKSDTVILRDRLIRVEVRMEERGNREYRLDIPKSTTEDSKR